MSRTTYAKGNLVITQHRIPIITSGLGHCNYWTQSCEYCVSHTVCYRNGITSGTKGTMTFRTICRRRYGGLDGQVRINTIYITLFMDKFIKHRNIVNYIKAQRLGWLGHVQRMSDARIFKMIFKWNHLTKRSQGKPKYDVRITSNRIFVKWRLKNDHLRSGSREMERGRWEGQNFLWLKKKKTSLYSENCKREISGSHGGGSEDSCPLRC
jgi:hypothetical protein